MLQLITESSILPREESEARIKVKLPKGNVKGNL